MHKYIYIYIYHNSREFPINFIYIKIDLYCNYKIKNNYF